MRARLGGGEARVVNVGDSGSEGADEGEPRSTRLAPELQLRRRRAGSGRTAQQARNSELLAAHSG